MATEQHLRSKGHHCLREFVKTSVILTPGALLVGCEPPHLLRICAYKIVSFIRWAGQMLIRWASHPQQNIIYMCMRVIELLPYLRWLYVLAVSDRLFFLQFGCGTKDGRLLLILQWPGQRKQACRWKQWPMHGRSGSFAVRLRTFAPFFGNVRMVQRCKQLQWRLEHKLMKKSS